jgi:hypothetical protein
MGGVEVYQEAAITLALDKYEWAASHISPFIVGEKYYSFG